MIRKCKPYTPSGRLRIDTTDNTVLMVQRRITLYDMNMRINEHTVRFLFQDMNGCIEHDIVLIISAGIDIPAAVCDMRVHSDLATP